MRKTNDLIEMCAKIKAHFPEFVQELKDNRDHEVSALPKRNSNFEVHQGRCQVLQEICAIFEIK